MDADAEVDPAVGGQRAIAFRQDRLHFDRTAHGIDDTCELDQQPVAGGLDDATFMARDLRVDGFGAQHLEPAESTLLVGLDQSRITGYIGRQYGHQPAFDAFTLTGTHRDDPFVHDPTPGIALATGAPATPRSTPF